MLTYKHTPFDEEITSAMIAYNATHQDKFTLIDARIISLIHSYTYYGQSFFASNQYLAEKCFATPATVQKSINKLLSHELIQKNVSCASGKKQRILTYNETGANKFKNENKPE